MFDGNSHDLRNFAVDLFREKELIIYYDSIISIELDNEIIYEASREMDPGYFYGVKMEFKGTGYMDYFYLKNQEDELEVELLP